MKKINLKIIGKIVPIIGVILLIYIIIDIGVEKIVNAFSLIPIQYYILGFLPFFVRLVIYPYKWQYVCKKQKMDLSYFYLMKVYLISMFYGTITPGGIGWHIRIFYLRHKSKASLEKCLANSLIDSFLGVLAGLTLALIGTLLFIETFPGLFPALLAYFVFNLAAFAVFMKKSGGGRIFNFFIKYLFPKKYRDKLDKSVDSVYEDIPRIRDLLIPFLLVVALWIITGTQVYIVAQAFSIDIPFHIFILINGIAVSATSILPITVGGLGIREGAFVFLLSVYGIEPHIAFVISLSGFLVKTLFPALIGMVVSFRKKVNFKILPKNSF